MIDPVINFGQAFLLNGIDDVETSFTLQPGQGALFPDPVAIGPHNLVIHNFTDYPNPADDPLKEILRITGPAGTGDVKTFSRAQEGTIAQLHNLEGKAYRVCLDVTKNLIDQIRAGIVAATTVGVKAVMLAINNSVQINIEGITEDSILIPGWGINPTPANGAPSIREQGDGYVIIESTVEETIDLNVIVLVQSF